jgi:hypothetical protein
MYTTVHAQAVEGVVVVVYSTSVRVPPRVSVATRPDVQKNSGIFFFSFLQLDCFFFENWQLDSAARSNPCDRRVRSDPAWCAQSAKRIRINRVAWRPAMACACMHGRRVGCRGGCTAATGLVGCAPVRGQTRKKEASDGRGAATKATGVPCLA